MKNNQLFSKVSGGKFKGKKILLPSKQTTRSTKMIIKESYFNTLQFDIIEKVFIEVFGGSGSMAIEAISRGAKHSYAIEKDKNAYKILNNNFIEFGSGELTCVFGDSFEKLKPLMEGLNEEIYLYLDPPFLIREGKSDIYEKTIKLLESLPSKNISIVAIEHISSYIPPRTIKNLILKKTKKFGNSSISYYSLGQ